MEKSIMTQNIVLALALLATSMPAFAEGAAGESIWTRDKLSGDWGGLRSDLGKHGIDMDIKLSQFYQDVTSGGVDSGNNGEFGYKADAWINLDAQKLFGSWDGLSFSMHVEHRDGNDVLADAGAFVFPNSPLLFPLPGNYDGTQVTGFTVNQALFDGKAAVLAGKLHAFDLLNGFFPNVVDSGLSGFMNANSIMSILSWGRWLTLSQYGAAAWTIEPKFGAQTGILLTGGDNVTTTWDTSDSFNGGTGILTFHRFIHEIDGKPGYVFIGVGGSTEEYASLDPTDWTDFPGEGAVDSKEKKPWEIAVYLYQIVWQAENNDKRFTQVFTGGSFGDDNPSFSDWDVFASVQTFGLFPSRPHDRMGIAGHYIHLADNFVDLVSSIPGENLRDEFWTTELFYNYEINPWLHLSPNFQYAQNENTGDNPAVILGTRLVVDF